MSPMPYRSALLPRQRFVARRILASTERLVDQVVAEDWALIPATLRERRGLLGELRLPRATPESASCIAALHAAVAESERLILHIVPPEAAHPDV